MNCVSQRRHHVWRVLVWWFAGLANLASVASAATTECRIPVPRQGLQRIELFVNTKNDGYLLVRFADPRFDDTTEVYRLRGCGKVASGVTAKSTYEATLVATGFKDFGALDMGAQREVVNAHYGLVRVAVSNSDVAVVLSETVKDRLDAIAALQRLVRLQAEVPVAQWTLVRADPILARVPANEFTAPANNLLSDAALARSYLSLDALLASTAGEGVHALLAGPYRQNLEQATQRAVAARVAMLVELEIAAAALIDRAASNGAAAARQAVARMKSAGYDSEGTQLRLAALVRQGGRFDEALELFESSGRSGFTTVRTAAAATLEAAYEKVARTGSAGSVAQTLEQLARAGFRSRRVAEESMAVLRKTVDFAPAMAIAAPLMGFEGVGDGEPLRTELTAWVQAAYVRLAADTRPPDPTVQAAGILLLILGGGPLPSPVLSGFLALHQAALLTDATRNAFMEATQRQGSFDDALAAHKATGDVNYVARLQGLARKPSERAALERVAVAELTDKSRLIEFDFTVEDTPTTGGKVRGGQTFEFLVGKDARWNATKDIAGVLTVRLHPDRPVPLADAAYRFTFSITARANGYKSGVGFLVGPAGDYVERASTKVTVTLGAGTGGSRVRAEVGSLELAYLDRGAAGGYTARSLKGDGSLEVSLIAVEAVAP